MGVGNYHHHAEHYAEYFIVSFDWNDDVDFDDYDQAGFNAESFENEVRYAVASALPETFTKHFECVPDFLERFRSRTGMLFIAESKTVLVTARWHENDLIVILDVKDDVTNSLIHVGKRSVTANNIRVQKHMLTHTNFELRVRTSAWTSGRVTLEDLK